VEEYSGGMIDTPSYNWYSENGSGGGVPHFGGMQPQIMVNQFNQGTLSNGSLIPESVALS